MGRTSEVMFAVSGGPAEGYTAVAEGDSYALVTEAANLDELRLMILDVVDLYFEDSENKPSIEMLLSL